MSIIIVTHHSPTTHSPTTHPPLTHPPLTHHSPTTHLSISLTSLYQTPFYPAVTHFYPLSFIYLPPSLPHPSSFILLPPPSHLISFYPHTSPFSLHLPPLQLITSNKCSLRSPQYPPPFHRTLPPTYAAPFLYTHFFTYFSIHPNPSYASIFSTLSVAF